MNLIMMRGALFFLLCLASGLAAVAASPEPVLLPASVDELPPTAAASFLAAHGDTQIIDVRTEDEWHTRGHIEKAAHHDYFHAQKTLDALAMLDKTKPCLLYCAIGGRAKLLALELHKLGFQKVLVLQGGFNAWVAAGMPIVQ